MAAFATGFMVGGAALAMAVGWPRTAPASSLPRALTMEGPFDGVVSTQCGTYAGTRVAQEPGVWTWRSIKYAQADRWAPPKAAACDKESSAVYNASTCGAECAQPGLVGGFTGVEDCLSLTIVAHERAIASSMSGGVPVIVWPRSASLVYGAGCDQPGWGGSWALAADARAIVVGVSFRQGVFGFLHLEGDDGEPLLGPTANNGIRDVLAALRWVKAHARAFGGDPARVMVIGESSGGTVASSLLVSPLARGLLHRVYAASPSVTMATPAQASASWWRHLVANLPAKCTTSADAVRVCLARMPARVILKAVDKVALGTPWAFTLPMRPAANETTLFLPVVDGTVISCAPAEVGSAPRELVASLPIAHAAVLVGMTREEVDFAFKKPHHKVLRDFNATHVRPWANVLGEGDDFVRGVSEAYGPRGGDDGGDGGGADREQRIMQLASDMRVVCPARAFAIAAARASAPFGGSAFAYLLTHTLGSASHLFGGTQRYAFHTLDFEVLVMRSSGGYRGRGCLFDVAMSAEDERVGGALRYAILSLAESGSMLGWAAAARGAMCSVDTTGTHCSPTLKARECGALRDNVLKYAIVN